MGIGDVGVTHELQPIKSNSECGEKIEGCREY